MHKKGKHGKIGIFITIIILTALVVVTNIDTSKFSITEGIVNKLVMPIQNGMTYLKNKIARNNVFFEDINNLKDENKKLKEQNEELNKQISEIGIIKAENKTLRQYAELTDQYTNYTTIPAYIINRDLGNLSNLMVINVGKREGVDANMPVVSKNGVVGYIISATETTSKVQLIIDPASSISAITNISRDNIVIKGKLGENNRLKATYIGTDADLILNEDVETSGLGGIYPKGLKIGKLIEIVEAPNITEKYAIIEPAVDFSKLETVLVIKEQ